MDDENELQRLLDGELSEERTRLLEARLAIDSELQDRLHALMQLEMLGLTSAPSPAVAPVNREQPFRPTGSWWTAAVGTIAAAAAILFWLRFDFPPEVAEVSKAESLALASTRRVEVRLTPAIAASHRVYDVDRSSPETSGEPISARTFAQVEAQGDRLALASLHMLAGHLTSAHRILDESADDGAEAWSDRAALALLEDDPARALSSADTALAREPDLSAAHWNRGLALRDLGLTRLAVAEFDAVAQRGEPGWAAEAGLRRDALIRQVDSVAKRWTQALEQGQALATTGQHPAPELLERLPGLFRLYFYDAVRSRRSAEEVRDLGPVAATLDRIHGGHALRTIIDDVTTADFRHRRSLAKAYARIDAMPEVQVEQFLSQVRRWQATDILLGALFKTGRWRHQAAEFARLARKNADPWFLDLARWVEIQHAMHTGAVAEAEVLLREAVASCGTNQTRWRCYEFHLQLAKLALDQYRIPLGLTQARLAWDRARREGMWTAEVPAMQLVGEARRLAGEFDLARAHLAEAALRSDDCVVHRNIKVAIAADFADRGRWSEAAGAMTDLPSCPSPPPLQAAEVWATVAHHRRDAEAVAEFESVVALRRGANLLSEGDELLVRQWRATLSGPRLTTDTRHTLGEVIRNADRLNEDHVQAHPNVAAARAGALEALLNDRWSENDPDGALALMTRGRGFAPTDSPCTVALWTTQSETRWVARDRNGGSHRALGEGTPDDPSLPHTFAAWLRECAQVDVINGPGVPIQPRLIPAHVPWRYRLGNEPRVSSSQQPWLVVHDPTPPEVLGLPRLSVWNPGAEERPAWEISGPEATPSRVLDAMGRAGYIEVHAHGLLDPQRSEAAYLALSPDERGAFALSAEMVRQARFEMAPIVVLGACRAAQRSVAPNGSWNLADAFLTAGSRSVIATADPIPDGGAAEVFAALRRSIRGGSAPAIALRDLRRTYGDEYDWVHELVVFE